MSNFGPPQIFPPVPVNIPGNEAPVTLVKGPIVFVQPDAAPALTSKTTVPLGPPSPADPIFVPSNANEVDPNTL